MKAQIHPEYQQASVVCSCGNSFNVGSTKGTIHVELCYNCHPFYTGQQRFVDTASRIERFKLKQAAATGVKKKKEERNQNDQQPQTLREMLQALKR
jgi:large subunit ribosomal protein L31